jgi:large subunit ribosomal protein L5
MNILQKKFIEEVMPQLAKEFQHKNVMAIPRIEKITVNVGTSRALKDQNFMNDLIKDLRQIIGQSPVKTKAKKAIAGFKIRQGQEVGVVVTLRGTRMWDFMSRLINAALPRIRDFQGIDKKNFDKQGNLNYAIREQIVFPEISHDDISTFFSMQVTVKTSAKTKDEGVRMLKLLGFPIRED